MSSTDLRLHKTLVQFHGRLTSGPNYYSFDMPIFSALLWCAFESRSADGTLSGPGFGRDLVRLGLHGLLSKVVEGWCVALTAEELEQIVNVITTEDFFLVLLSSPHRLHPLVLDALDSDMRKLQVDIAYALLGLHFASKGHAERAAIAWLDWALPLLEEAARVVANTRRLDKLPPRIRSFASATAWTAFLAACSIAELTRERPAKKGNKHRITRARRQRREVLA
ncbi:hypothetical protein C8R43DRAFT_1240817 [Mycena crocata]|nr:hypothetical protein C8R43DRAFT_1240817 [Mycena crocata]